MLTNNQGVLIQWSKGAEKLTGFLREESLGQTYGIFNSVQRQMNLNQPKIMNTLKLHCRQLC